MDVPTIDYMLNAQLNDGTEHILDPDTRGWADPEILAQTKTWNMFPKRDGLPAVTIQIPEDAKPVYKSRVFANMKYGIGFRCHAVGYHSGNQTFWVWIMPTGNVEFADEPQTPVILLNHLVNLAREKAQQEVNPEPTA